MTRAESTEEVHQVIGLPLKESDIVVCTILDGIVRALRAGNKVEGARGAGDLSELCVNSGLKALPAGTTSARVLRVLLVVWLKRKS